MAYLVYVANALSEPCSPGLEGYEQARHHLERRGSATELKQALEDLALANSQTIRLNDARGAREAVDEARRAKEEFVAKVSHEPHTAQHDHRVQ